MSRRSETTGLLPLVGASFLAHALVCGAVALFVNLAPRLAPPPQHAIMTKLVRLGVERPKELLPRKEEAPPPPPPAAVPVAPQAEAAAPKPPAAKSSEPIKTVAPAAANAPSARERINALSRTSKALDRLKQAVSGAADGSVDGDSDVRVLGNAYGTQVQKCIQKNYEIQGMDAAKVGDLNAVVWLRIAADGKIVAHRIEVSSGVAAFDQAVSRAVLRCGTAPPPPPELREQMRREGIEVKFVP